VVRVSACTSEQIFLSGSSAIHGEWSVVGDNDSKEDATENLKPLKHGGKEEAEEKPTADLRG
jgi:hypothetical protein